jgi:DNA-binding NarL/FixJ family response regulator
MSYTVETAPSARCRSVEARRAARQAKASREKRIVECLNRGVSVAEIAEREDVSQNRMHRLVRDILARRMPAPPAQFIVMQVNRLNEALHLSFDAMSGANLRAVDRVVRIVRELDR